MIKAGVLAFLSLLCCGLAHSGSSIDLRNTRMEKAKELLRQPDISIAEVAAKVGYENYKSFYRAFKDAVGTTPVEYQQKKYIIHREDEKQ